MTGWSPGDRVFVSHHIPCNTCRWCLRGCHTACESSTPRTTTREASPCTSGSPPERGRGVFLLPEEMSLAAGVMIEPLACVIRDSASPASSPASRCWSWGAASRASSTSCCRALGAGRILATDVHNYRCEAALRFGAEPSRTPGRTCRTGPPAERRLPADTVIVCAGAPSAFEQALRCVDRGGVVLCFATTEPDLPVALPLNDSGGTRSGSCPPTGTAPWTPGRHRPHPPGRVRGGDEHPPAAARGNPERLPPRLRGRSVPESPHRTPSLKPAAIVPS